MTPANIDTNYQTIINSVQNGTWATKGSVMLAHQSGMSTISYSPVAHERRDRSRVEEHETMSE